MSTYTQIIYQIVFGSKDYSPFLSNENENMLFAYKAGILKNKSCHPYIVGDVSNHIHIITHIHPAVALYLVVKDIKLASHKLILEKSGLFTNFTGWQTGYGAFTYNISSKVSLIKYVENQREHHKGCSYKTELTKLLSEHSVDFNEDFLLT